MSDSIKPLLLQIIRSSELHARWLNTLSYLEYIGFRKIVKSQMASQMDLSTLGHAIEEGRHAYVLKKQAVKMGGCNFDNYSTQTLLCGKEAENYFQSLDRELEACFQSEIAPERRSRLTYLYVTWLIEIRALSVYGLYQEALLDLGIQVPLKGILTEEVEHLESVQRELHILDPQFPSRVPILKQRESEFYESYVSAVSQELAERNGLCESTV